MKRVWQRVVLGFLVAVAGLVLIQSPFGRLLEERLGLALLFSLRGPRQPPPGVVIVNIDQQSTTLSGLPESYHTWPRSFYGRLLDRLGEHGAAVVVFDVHFAEAGDPVEDRVLAEAIRRFGTVILCGKLVRRPLGAGGEVFVGTPVVEVETLIDPATLFAEAALAVAPFPVPKVPVRVDRAWAFKNSAGDTPTLPVVALQALALNEYDHLRQIVLESIPTGAQLLPVTAEEAVSTIGLVETMRRFRCLLWQHQQEYRTLVMPETGGTAGLSDERQRALRALLAAYQRDDELFIDYYGPPTTVPILSFYDLLQEKIRHRRAVGEQLHGAVVFVGAVRTTWAEQKDGFYTVFSRADGLDLSGVELAATVFANLLEERPLRPLSAPLSGAVAGTVAAAAALVCFTCSPVVSATVLGCGSIVYLIVSSLLFSGNGLFVPTIVPLAIILPAVFLLVVIHRYATARREREHVRQALRLYLPEHVVEQLSCDLSYIRTGDQMIYAACLLSDAENYTTLAEQMDPRELSRLMKDYYEHLFRPVNQQGGLVCNVVGDAMFALWPARQTRLTQRTGACQAALQILDAVECFNDDHPEHRLPTRIGLHAGDLLMGNIGAADHFEYAPVGDIVNTASRLEGLNKHLGTRIVASAEAIDGVTAVGTRFVGSFLLGGKTQPVDVYEVTSRQGRKTTYDCGSDTFSEALRLFRLRRWDEAAARFRAVLSVMADDGPSLFYLGCCAAYKQQPPPADWSGAIRIGK